ncbi:hypothetical protein BD626DRAFT_565982 [Schizophyllum amplum]|uniref:F-box domain-containing protein n=1 Tax=Schizophyllum amplum TaxID=97359 RepID=A0A550CQ37_9AGAR|nr:hypothetical protein BD626DRAFT_565982 [Auriculariopsis ampla]
MHPTTRACLCRLCKLPAELLHEVAVLLVAIDDVTAPERLSATCPHLATLFCSLSEKGHICREVFNTNGIIRRCGWLAMECDEADVDKLSSRAKAEDLGELFTAVLDYVRPPIVNRLPLDNPDVEGAVMGLYGLLLMDEGKTREMVDQWGTYSFVMAYIRHRLSIDEVTEPTPWPEEDEPLVAALATAWILTTPENLRAEPPKERERLRRGLLPYIVMPFRYAVGELPAEFFYPPVTDGPGEHGGLPQTVLTIHGPYPIYPRAAVGAPTAPCVWPYAGRDFDFSHPLISSVARLHFFARQELGELKVPDHLPEDYETRRAIWLQEVRAGTAPSGSFRVELTKADVRKFNKHRGTPLPRLQYPEQWDADSMRCLMSSSLQVGFEPEKPPSALCDHIRLNHMYTPGLLDGLWRGRMLLPQLSFLQETLSADQRTPYFDARTSDMLMNFSAIRIREFVSDIKENARVPAENDARMGWLPYGTVLQVSDDGKECVASVNGDQRFVYRHITEHQKAHRENEGAECFGCRVRERLDGEDVESVFESVGLGLEETTCDDCDGPVRRPSAQFSYAFGTPVREGGMTSSQAQPQPEEDEKGQTSSDDDDEETSGASDDGYSDAEGPCFSCRRRVLPPRQMKPCNHVASVLLHGTVDEADAAALYDYEVYGRVRPCDGMVGLLRFPKKNSLFTPEGEAGAYYTFFYGYIIGGQNFVGTWRIVFPKGMAGRVVLGENGGVGGAAEGGTEIFWEGPFTMQKAE